MIAVRRTSIMGALMEAGASSTAQPAEGQPRPACRSIKFRKDTSPIYTKGFVKLLSCAYYKTIGASLEPRDAVCTLCPKDSNGDEKLLWSGGAASHRSITTTGEIKMPNTSRYIEHLRNHHNDQYKEFQQASLISLRRNEKSKPKKSASGQTFDPLNALETTYLRFLYMFMVISTYSSIRYFGANTEVVELALNPMFTVPCYSTFISHAVFCYKISTAAHREKLDALVRHYGGLSFLGGMTDMWTSAAGDGYCSVDVQFVDQHCKLQSCTLSVDYATWPLCITHRSRQTSRQLQASGALAARQGARVVQLLLLRRWWWTRSKISALINRTDPSRRRPGYTCTHLPVSAPAPPSLAISICLLPSRQAKAKLLRHVYRFTT